MPYPLITVQKYLSNCSHTWESTKNVIGNTYTCMYTLTDVYKRYHENYITHSCCQLLCWHCSLKSFLLFLHIFIDIFIFWSELHVKSSGLHTQIFWFRILKYLKKAYFVCHNNCLLVKDFTCLSIFETKNIYMYVTVWS